MRCPCRRSAPMLLARAVARALAFALAVAATPPIAARAQSPQAAVDELLAADRAFSASGRGTDLVTSLAAMFADDVSMPAPPGRFATGKPDAIAALKGNPANLRSTVEWAPVRGGLSADGLHGFTFGLMSVRRPDGTTGAAKYLAYWVKGPSGWRVAAYKRVGRADGDVNAALLPAALPAQLVAPVEDAGLIEQHRASLVAAEKGFSDLAQKIGLGPAFRETGSSDAINLGGAALAGFVIGNDAIARHVGADQPPAGSSVTWSADRALVASSGDLGVTFGFIKPNGEPQAGAPSAGFPFFTIWRRAGPGAPWRYVAE